MSHVDPLHDPQMTVGSIVPLDIGKPTNIDSLAREQFVTRDSGNRQEFATGSRRDTREGKGRFDLIPPTAEQRLADLYERGADKYGDRNWEKGQPLMRYVDSARRHLNRLVAGEPTEDHATAVQWNMIGYTETKARIEAGLLPAELDDRPPPAPEYRTGHDPVTGKPVVYGS